MGWDELVIEAVCDRYGLDRAVMALPKKGQPAEETPAKKRSKGKGKK
jgi:hypothetical protein